MATRKQVPPKKKRDDRTGRHPVLRRLRRRHADHGQPVHEHGRPVRQRPRHLPRLPGRDPRPCGHPARRERLPDQLLLPRRLHAGRRGGRAGGHEPGRAQDEHRRPEAERHPHRQHRQLQGDRPQEGAVPRRTRSRTTPSTATGSSRSSSPSSRAPPCATSASTPRAWTGARTSSPWACATGSTTGRWTRTLQVARRQVQEQAGPGRGQQAGHEGGLRVLRRHRGLPGPATRSRPRSCEPGIYRNISGNTALALGFVAAAQKAGLPLFQGSYPITPASDILHELSMYKEFGVITFQAEDEIAAMTSVDRRGLRRRAGHHHHLRARAWR